MSLRKRKKAETRIRTPDLNVKYNSSDEDMQTGINESTVNRKTTNEIFKNCNDDVSFSLRCNSGIAFQAPLSNKEDDGKNILPNKVKLARQEMFLSENLLNSIDPNTIRTSESSKSQMCDGPISDFTNVEKKISDINERFQTNTTMTVQGGKTIRNSKNEGHRELLHSFTNQNDFLNNRDISQSKLSDKNTNSILECIPSREDDYLYPAGATQTQNIISNLPGKIFISSPSSSVQKSKQPPSHISDVNNINAQNFPLVKNLEFMLHESNHIDCQDARDTFNSIGKEQDVDEPKYNFSINNKPSISRVDVNKSITGMREVTNLRSGGSKSTNVNGQKEIIEIRKSNTETGISAKQATTDAHNIQGRYLPDRSHISSEINIRRSTEMSLLYSDDNTSSTTYSGDDVILRADDTGESDDGDELLTHNRNSENKDKESKLLPSVRQKRSGSRLNAFKSQMESSDMSCFDQIPSHELSLPVISVSPSSSPTSSELSSTLKISALPIQTKPSSPTIDITRTSSLLFNCSLLSSPMPSSSSLSLSSSSSCSSLSPQSSQYPVPPLSPQSSLSPGALDSSLSPGASQSSLPPSALQSSLSPGASQSSVSLGASQSSLSPGASQSSLSPGASQSPQSSLSPVHNSSCRRKKGQSNTRERTVRRIESNERERMRMHSLNDAFQVRGIVKMKDEKR